MSSVVHYKFKSQRDASRVVFDGTALSVYDLKREIMVQNKMGKGIDFDIALYNAQTEEEYRDDNHLIPRSSTVLVRRLPPQRPGRGTAQMYVADLYGGDAGEGSSSRFGPAASGMAQGRDRQQQQPGGPSSYRGPMSVRFDDRGKEPSATPAPPPVLPPSMTQQGAAGESNGGDEAASIAAMFQATTDQWDATQQQMANATYRSRGGGPPRGGGRGGSFQARSDRGDHHQYSDRPPPVGYICYRCGKKGHWIQECPTNLDPNWDDKPRFKRTTGIPKSMLKTVENPTETQRQAGIMVTSDGTYVVAQVDSATWEAERSAALKTLSRSDVFAAVPTDSALACPLCSKLLKKAVKTPCCTTRFCEECIQNHLLENDFKCAECDKRIADLGDLARDDEVRRKVEEYVEEAIRRSEEEIKEREAREAGEAGEGEKKEGEGEEAGDAEPGGEGGGGGDKDKPATTETGTEQITSSPDQPAIPVVAFNPQLVQQLVMTLSNPQLPPPMKSMLQTQLQAQQMAFMRLKEQQQQQQQFNAQQGGMMGGMGMGMGGGMQQQHQMMMNPMMGMMNNNGGGAAAMSGNGNLNNNGFARPPPPQQQRMGNHVGAMGMGMGRGGMAMGMPRGGMKRGFDGPVGFDQSSKMARMQ